MTKRCSRSRSPVNANLMAAAGQFQQTLRSRGVRISEDVLQKLGPECAILVNWRAGARAPDCAIVSEITDAATLRPALDGVMNALKETALGGDDRFPWDETEYAGQKLRTVHIGVSVSRRRTQPRISFSFSPARPTTPGNCSPK